MYNIGELVQYGNSGVCKIEEIMHGMPGLDKNVDYYLMVPVNGRDGKIYAPVNNENLKMRKILTREDAKKLIDSVPEVVGIKIVNEKQCEAVYKEALYSVDCSRWLELLKTLYIRRDQRTKAGKKITATDERYLKNAEERFFDEFSIVLGEEEAKDRLADLPKKMLETA
ncbi:MAG: CarD family transcriptional regulator [Lachnospiraceae bacterium]|nr:CarD family transcriptional regulator [Lachnospiraceae bacterium]